MEEILSELEKLGEAVSRSLLACILNSSTDAIIGKDASGTIFRWGRGAEKLSGYSAQEAVGKNISFLFPPDKWEPYQALIEEAKVSGLIENLETAWVRKDGITRQMLMNIAAISGEKAGEIRGFTIIAQDITERIETQEALCESELHYRKLFETARDGILLLDAGTGEIYDANPYILDILGYTHDELVGKKLWDIGSFKNIDASEDTFRELLEKGKNHVEDLPIETKDGRAIEVEFVSTFYYSADSKEIIQCNISVGSKEVIQCNIRDITEKKALERQKADFYAMVTHDIRSPLTSVIGYSELLKSKSDKFDAETNQMVATIMKSGERIEHLLENFLTISKIDAGKFVVTPAPTDIAALLRDACSDIEMAVQKKKLDLKIEIADGLPQATVDPKLIQRAVLNLLHNAINYTPAPGTITLKAVFDGNFIIISVTDTGKGIPADEQKAIFAKYFRSQKTSGVKGSGLGLAIVKSAVEAHGGRVEVESELGKGSTFKMFFPVTNPSVSRNNSASPDKG